MLTDHTENQGFVSFSQEQAHAPRFSFDEGLYQHFRAIAEAVDIAQILYNVPGRTVPDISNDTVLRLAQIPNIVGIKDATGDMGRGFDLLCRAPQDFSVYSGDDASGLALLLLGADGVISVTANVAPKLMHEMCIAAFAGDLAPGAFDMRNPIADFAG